MFAKARRTQVAQATFRDKGGLLSFHECLREGYLSTAAALKNEDSAASPRPSEIHPRARVTPTSLDDDDDDDDGDGDGGDDDDDDDDDRKGLYIYIIMLIKIQHLHHPRKAHTHTHTPCHGDLRVLEVRVNLSTCSTLSVD